MKTFNEWSQDEKLKRIQRTKKKVMDHRTKTRDSIRDEREKQLEKKREEDDKKKKMREREALRREIDPDVRAEIERE